MTDRHQDVSQYKYSAMSNLVLQADRRFITRRTDESTGDPESLAGRLSIRDMGSRVPRDKAPKLQKSTHIPRVERASLHEGEDILLREQSKRRSDRKLRGTGILGAAELPVEGIRYRPRTQATRATFDLILTLVGANLGDVSLEIVHSAADAVLEYLKDPNIKDFDKKQEIDELLGGSLSSKQFNELVNLSKKITDYDIQEEDGAEIAEATDETELDDRQGVAVVFDDDEDDALEDNAIGHEAGDVSSSDELDNRSNDTGSPSTSNRAHEERGQRSVTAGRSTLRSENETLVLDSMPLTYSSRQTKDKDMLPSRDIDAFWLQRQIGKLYADPHIQHDKAVNALQILSGRSDTDNDDHKPLREIENDLMELFEWEHNDLVQLLIANRDKVLWLTRLCRADNTEERKQIEQEMSARGLGWMLDEYRSVDAQTENRRNMQIRIPAQSASLDGPPETIAPDATDGRLIGGLMPKRTVDLENMVFDQGNHLMTNPAVTLPEGSIKRTFKGYEEIHIPAPRRQRDAGDANISISELPAWAQTPFSTARNLNRIQSKCYPAAFQDDGNMLVCAPTGSGKTNVAMLTILREVGKHRNHSTGEINLDAFKIVYIAPLKALVQEQVGNFGQRLAPYGITVSELTGDRQLTKQQISETQIIVTTPEKWDVITRKATELSYTNLVGLVIIDEIHLLHDNRGPVLESIVSRTLRKTEQSGESVRLVGLSATLPNYRDVANFLRVDIENNLFFFDGTYRPCPLRQEFIGVTDKKAIKQLKTMNEITYLKVIEHVGTHRNQVLIFVHSRKETARTARFVRDRALDMDTINQILRHDAGSREVLAEAASQASDKDLKDLLPYGFAIHHAGMNRIDRTDVEDLFARGAVQVLVCTATLAWGVNLPAHTVIIKGTQVYSPEKGNWVELSPQDVLQMLGRAGRPQFDTYGEGIILTTQAEMRYYLSLLNQQLPIESQLAGRLVDCLNAEIVLGNVNTRDEGVDWLGYTYLFVRMLRAPGLYSVGPEYENDKLLEQKRVDLVHSAAAILMRSGLIKYEEKSGKMQPTELGRIASHYYITHGSMEVYNALLQPSISTIDLFRVFALSAEFKFIPVRQDEKVELAKLLGRVPIPVKENIEEPHCKINVLLQAYISRLSLDGLALMADMVYVTQSAGRILRAVFEICLKKGWASVAKASLELCKMAEKRMWPTMTPLRQFRGCPRDVVTKVERKDLPWSSYFGLDPPRMGELLGLPKAGRAVCTLVSKFPKLEVQAQVQPLTRSVLRVELVIVPSFDWDDEVHGVAEAFWVIVEDCDGENVLFHDQFLLRKDYAQRNGENDHVVEFTVPIGDPMPPNYFISVVSDRWMHCETRIPVSFGNLVLPERFPPHTALLDLQPLPVSALKGLASLYPGWEHFNKIQTQTFQSLFNSDDNIFVGAPTGTGKTVCAEFAILRLWTRVPGGRALYLAPFQELVDCRLRDWQQRLSAAFNGKVIIKLTGDAPTDVGLLGKSDLILATPSQWDALSRLWKKRKSVRDIRLCVADELHMLGGPLGHLYEIAVSRMHHIRTQMESPMRIVGLSVSVANARDIGEWIDATKHNVYNFGPHLRTVPLELHIQSFTNPHFPSLMLSMAKPTYMSIVQLSSHQPALVFVPNRKQARATTRDILAACLSEDEEDRFLHVDLDELRPLLERVNEEALAEALSHGIGYYHEALSLTDRRIVKHLYDRGALQVLVASRDTCWELDSTSHLIVVMGTQYFDGREHRYVDYSVSEILQMFGKASKRSPQDGRARGVLMLPAVRKEFYKKFLNEAIPVESHLWNFLHDAFLAEVSTKVIETADDAISWMTYTYFYRRLLANPSYYNLSDTSHDGLSQYLSDLVENTLKELAESRMIEVDEAEGTIEPENAAHIAAYYNISHVTMQTFLLSLSGKTKLKGILEIIASATEFDSIQIRRHEEDLLRRIYDRVPAKMSQVADESPHFKAFVLLQAHFSRMQLPIDLARDQEVVLSRVLGLLSAVVDILSSGGHLNALNAMEMSQMVVQAMWDRDSPLKQIPHFSSEVVKAAEGFGIRDIYDFMEAMNPQDNSQYGELVRRLGLSRKQLAEAAQFTNTEYPEIAMDYNVVGQDHIEAGSEAEILVRLERESESAPAGEEGTSVGTSVHAPFYPGHKTENWWIVVGEEATRALYGIKKISFARKEMEVRVKFTIPTAGKHHLKLFLMSDSYVGVDQEPDFVLDVNQVIEADPDDSD